MWLQLPAHLDEIFWAGVLGFAFGFALIIQELRRRVVVEVRRLPTVR